MYFMFNYLSLLDELYNKNISDYYPEPYAHRPKELRRVSVESRPSASNLGSFGSYYM